MGKAKPYDIAKREVWEAYRKVKANRGAAGVDAESLAAFEKDLKNNLYKIWNRMSSGSYFPPPVRRVEIEKKEGGAKRLLGVPTVADRVAQTVAKRYLDRSWNRCSTRTPTGTVRASLHTMHWARRGSGAGTRIG